MKLTNELLNKKRDDLCRCEEINRAARRQSRSCLRQSSRSCG